MVWFDLLEDVETNAFGYGRSGDIADEWIENASISLHCWQDLDVMLESESHMARLTERDREVRS
jgi:hypothetical protein